MVTNGYSIKRRASHQAGWTLELLWRATMNREEVKKVRFAGKNCAKIIDFIPLLWEDTSVTKSWPRRCWRTPRPGPRRDKLHGRNQSSAYQRTHPGNNPVRQVLPARGRGVPPLRRKQVPAPQVLRRVRRARRADLGGRQAARRVSQPPRPHRPLLLPALPPGTRGSRRLGEARPAGRDQVEGERGGALQGSGPL